MTEQLKPTLSPVFRGIEQAFKTWWEHLMKFVMIFVWSVVYAFIPLIIFVVMTILDSGFGQANPVFSVATVIIGVAASLVATYFGIRGQIGAYLLIKKGYTGDEKAIFAETEPWFWSYLGLSLLTALFVLLWMLLLIIPGIVYAVFYSFASYVLFFEGLKGRAALKRSIEIVKGYFWPVFGRFLLVGLLIGAISAAVASPLDILAEKSTLWYLYNSVVQVTNFLIGPIFLIYGYNIYQELVAIKAKS